MEPKNRTLLTRRSWLAAAASATWAISAGPRVLAGSAPAAGPFKLGIQSYSLRGFSLDRALALSKDLGLRYWESFSAHIPTDAAKAAEFRDRARDAGVEVIGYGVMRFTKDRDANRPIFDFAKALGVQYLSADPDRDAFDVLDKLVEEYGIALGIHNHGPGHKWEKIATIRDAIKDHHKLIGCCVDTGHFLRSKEDPVEAVEAFEGRVYGVHLKDVKDAKTFTVLGEGDLKTAELLSTLARQKYDYCLALEYEENPDNPIADIKACLAALEKAMPK